MKFHKFDILVGEIFVIGLIFLNFFAMGSIRIGLILIIVSGSSFSQPYLFQVSDFPNESMGYNLYYGFLKIGAAQLEFSSTLPENALFIIAEASSVGLIRFVKDVHYRYESCFDTATGLPFFDSRILVEGDYEDLNTVYYYHFLRKDSTIIYSEKTDSVLVPKGIYDLLSGFYHYRENYIPNRLNSKEKASIKAYFIDKVWDLNITYLGIENIQTILGEKECYIIKPETVVGQFFSKPDAVTIWITKDQYKIPVKFCLELKIGTLCGRINTYQKPGNCVY